MQKACFTAILLFTCSHIFGQNVFQSVPKLPLLANKIVYSDTVVLDTARTQAQLFDNAHEWYRYTYETSDNRLTIDNSDAGMITGTGTVNFKKHKGDYKDLQFTIDVVAGKGYYAYRIYNLQGYDNGVLFDYSDINNEELYPIPKPRWPAEVRADKLNNLDMAIKEIAANLQAGMQKELKR